MKRARRGGRRGLWPRSPSRRPSSGAFERGEATRHLEALKMRKARKRRIVRRPETLTEMAALDVSVKPSSMTETVTTAASNTFIKSSA